MANMNLVTGHAGAAHVSAEDHAALNAAIFGTGEFVLNIGNKFAAAVVSNNQIRIESGEIIMQGRHCRISDGNVTDLMIENGKQGILRNDLIVARYTKDNSTGVEECNLVVIKGTGVSSNPYDPKYTKGNILNGGAILNDMPLYRVVINGINIEEVVPLFGEISLSNGGSTSYYRSGAISDTLENNTVYHYTNVTSLNLTVPDVQCHIFLEVGASDIKAAFTGSDITLRYGEDGFPTLRANSNYEISIWNGNILCIKVV